MKKNPPVMPTSISPALRKIFDEIVKACSRSTTKKNLHSDPKKEEALAWLLNNIRTIFGSNLATKFQGEYEAKNPALSFLYAQITNAVIERAFHEGSCHAQAAYSLIELAKNRIFKASLVCSRTGNLSTEHFYVLLLEDHTYNILASHKDIFIPITKNRFNPVSTFFDTWSNQLCRWDEFKAESPYTKEIRNTTQALFKSFLHLFGSEAKVIETINWCLEKYENELKALALPEFSPQKHSISDQSDQAFQDECELLTSSQKCLSKILDIIKLYKEEFAKLSKKKDDTKLFNTTIAFFKQSSANDWKVYPSEKMAQSKHKGNDVRYMKAPSSTELTQSFFKHLQKEGFDTEIVGADEKSFILVDLTFSK